VPNSGEGLKRLEYRVGGWDVAFAAHVRGLAARGKPVVVAGDLNVAHAEIDIHDPVRNARSPGFTREERDSFGTRLLGGDGDGGDGGGDGGNKGEGLGLVDSFRAMYPKTRAYTYYGHRTPNARRDEKGWRLDYFLVDTTIAPRVHDAFVLKEVAGSDHVPLGVVLLRKK
jgi:exonuclease III